MNFSILAQASAPQSAFQQGVRTLESVVILYGIAAVLLAFTSVLIIVWFCISERKRVVVNKTSMPDLAGQPAI